MTTRRRLALGLACALCACGADEGNEQQGGTNAADKAAPAAARARGSIADALGQPGQHSSFARALESAGLLQTLRGTGPYTVFAPTDAAFAAIPADFREALQSPQQRGRAAALLTYHIVPGTVTAEDLGRAIDSGRGGRAELATMAGDNLTLSRDGEAVIVGDGSGGRARITNADRIVANGVVHGIDAVLMPATE